MLSYIKSITAVAVMGSNTRLGLVRSDCVCVCADVTVVMVYHSEVESLFVRVRSEYGWGNII